MRLVRRQMRRPVMSSSSSDSDSDLEKKMRLVRRQVVMRRPVMSSSSSDSDSDSMSRRRAYMGNRLQRMMPRLDFDPRVEFRVNPRPRRSQDIMKSMTLTLRDAPEEKKVNIEVHKEVLAALEELVKTQDKEGIKRLAAQIKASPSALEHVKQYPSMYKKALGDHYPKFEKYIQ